MGLMTATPFIMMSFDGNLSSMSTLAHELGHSMHSRLHAGEPAFHLQQLFHVRG